MFVGLQVKEASILFAQPNLHSARFNNEGGNMILSNPSISCWTLIFRSSFVQMRTISVGLIWVWSVFTRGSDRMHTTSVNYISFLALSQFSVDWSVNNSEKATFHFQLINQFSVGAVGRWSCIRIVQGRLQFIVFQLLISFQLDGRWILFSVYLCIFFSLSVCNNSDSASHNLSDWGEMLQ